METPNKSNESNLELTVSVTRTPPIRDNISLPDDGPMTTEACSRVIKYSLIEHQIMYYIYGQT
jgi:hypothetical protein